MSRFLALLASAMLAAPVFAQETGLCEIGTAQAVLDVSGVRASLFNHGGLFYNGTRRDGYVVPRWNGSPVIEAAALWIGGKVGGSIRTTHSRFGNRQMWPGPLDDGATLPNPSDCSTFDRVYVVSTHDVVIYEQTGVASSDLADWPVGLGAPAVDANGLAVVVTSREQTLELANGERPVISGTQTAFWVMNDVGNQHTDYQGNTRGAPLGVEVAVLASAVASDETALHLGTFYRYTVTNRNTQPITDAVLGFFVNPYKGDDYTGVDTTRGLGFSYSGYGAGAEREPYPAIGFDLLDGLGAFVMTRNDDYCTSSLSPSDVYGVLNGLWPDGSPIHENGLGCNTSGPVTRFAFAGDPVTESFWSMNNLDRNGASTAGGYFPFTIASPRFDLAPGASRTFGLAVLFARGTDHLDSITELRAASDRVQSAYDAGTLFQRSASPPVLSAPVVVSPDDGADLALTDTVRFTWETVVGAEAYEIRWGPQRNDLTTGYQFVADTVSVFLSSGLTPTPGTRSVYWAVQALASGAVGLRSEPRSLRVYRGGALQLADGSPAYVEVSGPDGADPCAEGAVSRDGCDEVSGNLVYHSLNSTGEYYFSERGTGSEPNLGGYAPNDFEIRFTDRGSLGYYTFQDGNIISVPFEIWDIGVVAPGEANDPADDVRLIPVLFADQGGTCSFNADEISEGSATETGYVESDRVYAYYPVATYEAFELAFADSVATAPDNCYTDSDSTADEHLDFGRGRPIQRQVFGSLAASPTLPATGTVIRFYTVDPLPVADEASPRVGDLSLGAPYPNPTASSLTVPYRLVRSSAVELAIYDVLGRRVLELVNARQPEGAHTAHLDARALAPGLYIVRLRAGEETRTTRITVVR